MLQNQVTKPEHSHLKSRGDGGREISLVPKKRVRPAPTRPATKPKTKKEPRDRILPPILARTHIEIDVAKCLLGIAAIIAAFKAPTLFATLLQLILK